MSGGIPVARLFGIEVRVSFTLAVMVGIVALIGTDQAGVMAPELPAALRWAVGIGVAALFLVTVMVHELAHALVGRRRGVPTTVVVLGLVGGLAPLSIEAAAPRDELAIALAGPLASLAIALVTVPVGALLGSLGSPLGPVAGGLLVVGALNVMLGVGSLLPGLPLDGGRVVRALAWARTGDRDRAAAAAARGGQALGWAIVAVGVVVILADDPVQGLLLMVLGWLVAGASRGLLQRAEMERAVRGLTVGEGMLTGVPQVGPGLTLDTFAGRLGIDGAPSALPVVDGDRVLGVVGMSALRRLGHRRWATTRTAEVMAAPPKAPFVTARDPMWGALESMQQLGLDGLVVVEDDRLAGLVTRESAAEAMRARLPEVPSRRGRRRSGG